MCLHDLPVDNAIELMETQCKLPTCWRDAEPRLHEGTGVVAPTTDPVMATTISPADNDGVAPLDVWHSDHQWGVQLFIQIVSLQITKRVTHPNRRIRRKDVRHRGTHVGCLPVVLSQSERIDQGAQGGGHCQESRSGVWLTHTL